MQRRSYLALASSLCLAGCTGAAPIGSSSDSDPKSDAESNSPSKPDPNEPTTDASTRAGMVDDFETLDTWEPFGATLSADPNRSAVGTQSARLEIPADQRTGGIVTAFSEPQDLTDVVPGLAVATDRLNTPWLRLVDDHGNEINYRRGIKGGLPLVRYNFGVDDVDAGFDPAAVRKVRVLAWAGDEPLTLWLDDFHLVPRPDTGKVMIQFDDAHVTDYTEALPILEEYGYPAVTFINPGRLEAQRDGVEDPGGFPRITIDQAHELHDAGWVVANHCYSHPHLSELDRAAQEEEISAGKAWLEAEGFDEGARYFAYPHGDYDERTLELVAEYHDIGFAGGRPVQGYAVNRRQTSRIGEPSAERARTAIERTASMRGITSLFFHRLEGDLLADFEATVEAIREYEAAGEIDVILPADLEPDLMF
ncbi:polysaccharide deacetylase family protein [Natrinema salifodinae]|uniref:Peptidoglycan/xylan/chitin deacetylase, PgdA/CDA1 family n=1 Tax=Natrinema salifodinae TaxID=1202768 RepID=A0A1I0PH96_9EURY|nr:polysaccharide deacetylase family protein [Natrinema salifodinae]SEW13815.1 Peptidoglycan/xylan/chitin deacetylase, PgdA/CDA1 family [Natrinema salifodinae]